jgi:hypothetical protein
VKDPEVGYVPFNACFNLCILIISVPKDDIATFPAANIVATIKDSGVTPAVRAC